MSTETKVLRDAIEEELVRLVTVWPQLSTGVVAEIASALGRNARRLTAPDVQAAVTTLIETTETKDYPPRPGDVVKLALTNARVRRDEPGTRSGATPQVRIATDARCSECGGEVLFLQSEFGLYCRPCNTLQRVDAPEEDVPRYRMNAGECGRVKSSRCPVPEGEVGSALINFEA